jgi:hypothetical protein
MNTFKDSQENELDELIEGAIASLNKASNDFEEWIELVRDPEKPFAFKWANESVRDANVGASNYILQTASFCGKLNEVLNIKQKEEGAKWIKSLEETENIFVDPALVDRQPPGWDKTGEGWPPDGAHKEANNQYARGCLRFYEDKRIDQLSGPTPPTWPQKGDENVLDWIKKVEPNWSWIGRILHRVLPWYHEGAISKETLMDCMNYVYSRQEPDTGFWAKSIQRTFKLLIPVHDPAEIKVPNADKIIDSVINVMDNSNYDDNLFPCEEFDAFYDLAIALNSVPGYREEEIKKLAAYRVKYILDTHTQKDKGLSSYTDKCIPTWLNWDMAPPILQGDAFGWGIYGYGLNICVDILGISDRVSWTGKWRQREEYDTSIFIEVGKEIENEISIYQ